MATLTGVPLRGKMAEEVDQAFVIEDKDSDGKVTKEQCACIIRSIGLCPTQEQLNEILGDRDRLFTKDEVKHLIQTRCPEPDSQDALREAFRIFDKDGAGSVNANDLRHALLHLGEKLKDDEVDEMIREVEINGDNQISCDDFVRTMHSLQ